MTETNRSGATARRPLAVDLFAGAGGLSLGLEQAGFDVVASVEYDPIHAATHEFNFPLTEVVCRDASSLDSDELHVAAARGRERHGHLDAWDGDIDLIVGGPPCQGFSMIGKRLMDDPRNELVFHFFRLVRELRPRYFVMENVPGMRIGGHSSILARLVDEFRAEQYQVADPVQMLNAREYGVPQERHRIFLLGARAGEPLPAYPDPTMDATTVWDAIGDIPDLDAFEDLVHSDEVMLSLEHTRECALAASAYARRLRGDTRDPFDRSHPREWTKCLLTSSMRTRHTPLSISRFTATMPGEVEAVSRFPRLRPEGVCNTLRAGTGRERGAYTSPRPIHPFLPRVISVREAARLHSFPDWFRFHRTKWHGFRQIGNSVVPLVGRAVGYEIMRALAIDPIIPTQPLPLGDPRLLTMTMSEAAAHYGVVDGVPAPRKREVAVP